MKTPASLGHAVATVLLLAAGSAAASESFPGTTCGFPSSVSDLSGGAYQLPGRDRTYAWMVHSGQASLQVNQTSPPLVLAVCRDPPSPTADCTAIEVAPGFSQQLNLRPTRPFGSPNIWIVVDSLQPVGSTSPPDCGEYLLVYGGPPNRGFAP
jgi:hypothetical protein